MNSSVPPARGAGDTSPAPDAQTPDRTAGDLHLGSGPRIDPATQVDATKVHPLLPTRDTSKPRVKRKDDPDVEDVSDAGDAGSDLPA